MIHRFCVGISVFAALTFPIAAFAQSSLPTVAFTRSSYLVNENVGNSQVLTLVRNNGDLSQSSTVVLKIAPDSMAKDGEDYDLNKIELTVEFKPGESTKIIPVTIVNDKIVEEKETINFEIAEVRGAKLGTQTTATLEITDIDTSKLPNAIRFALVNGVIEYVNKAQQATIDLEWDLLPLEGNNQLKQEIRENYPDSKPITCLIRNEELETKKWINNLSKDCQSYLTDALKTNNLSNLGREEKFENFWTKPPLETKSPSDNGKTGYEVATTSGISVPQYFGVLRDYLQMKLLLSSNGINIFLDVDGEQKPQGEFPQVFNKDISWEIKIYRFPLTFTPEKTYFYRFTAKAIVDRFKLVFPVPTSKSASTSPQAKISVNFKKSPGTAGLIRPNLAANPLELKTVARDKISELQSTNADTELITTLGYFFNLNNADFGRLASNGFLENLPNTSIIAGGLIGDRSVDSLVGINTKLADLGDVKLGGIIGIGINNGNPLFIGPSLSYYGLTFSAGARVSSRNDTVQFERSGLISLDLSQAFGGQQQDRQKIVVDKAKVGGNWGTASDEISKDLALIYWNVKLSETAKKENIYLVNIKKCNDSNPLPSEQQAKIPVLESTQKLRFITKGEYEFQKDGKPYKVTGKNLKFCQAKGVQKFDLNL